MEIFVAIKVPSCTNLRSRVCDQIAYVKLPNRKIISGSKMIAVFSTTGVSLDVCLIEMEMSEEFLEGVRLEMLAAAYGSKWTSRRASAYPATPTLSTSCFIDFVSNTCYLS
jgi:hypothetical protein